MSEVHLKCIQIFHSTFNHAHVVASPLALISYTIGLTSRNLAVISNSPALCFRGQESAGIVTCGGGKFHIQKNMGLVRNVFGGDNLAKLQGSMGIGHTRYSTSAASERINCQPFVVHSMHGSLAVAHNGELVNKSSLRKTVCIWKPRFVFALVRTVKPP